MNARMPLSFLALTTLVACGGPMLQGQEARPPVSQGDRAATAAATAPARAAATITPEDMQRRIAYLASDELKGRDTPSPGLDAAADYIAKEFARLGLRPAGDDGSYIQRYALQRRALAADQVRFSIGGTAGARTLVAGKDYAAMPGVPARVSGAPVVAVRSLDPNAEALRGRIAVTYLAGAATSRDFFRALQGVRAAGEAAGVAATIVVLDPAVSEQDVARLLELNTETGPLALGELTSPPVFLVRHAAAKAVFAQAGHDLDAVRAATAPTELHGLTVELSAPVRIDRDDRAPNVVAVLPGSDPALRDEYVVFSAHMDHVGVRNMNASGDSIFNGADDNASGTSALLEVAEAFASMETPPARSLVFLAVSGEEKGLLGSRYYSDHPTVPIEKIVANINVDMIGRNAPDSIVVIGQEYSSLGPLVREVAAANPDLGLTVAPDLWPQERFFFRSDHFNFARKDIPALFFFAGVHEDYHQPSDEADKIDADKAARVARLIFLTAYEIASRPQAPTWTEEGLREVRALTAGGR